MTKIMKQITLTLIMNLLNGEENTYRGIRGRAVGKANLLPKTLSMTTRPSDNIKISRPQHN